MFEFIETGLAIKKLYQYVKSEVVDQDFWAFSANDYLKLPEEDRNRKWYVLNPDKLNNKHSQDPSAFIVDEDEKDAMIRAVKFVNETTNSLPADSSFLERLLYTKNFIPPCFFSDKTVKNNDSSVVSIKLYGKK